MIDWRLLTYDSKDGPVIADSGIFADPEWQELVALRDDLARKQIEIKDRLLALLVKYGLED